MKKIITIIFILFISITSFSQELPHAKQYLLDQTLMNPAIGARYDFMMIKLVGKEKWIQLPEHPKVQSLSFNMKFKNKMGFNTAFLHESYGAVSNTGFKLSYFYYTKLNTKGDFISFGIYASFSEYSFNILKLNPNEIDPAISNNSMTAFVPNAGIGIYYQVDKLSLGFSAGNLLPYKPNIFDSPDEPFKTRTYFLYSEYRFQNEINTFAIVPSIGFIINERLQREVNINTKLIFVNAVWVGLSYSDALTSNSYAARNIMTLIGFNFFKRLNIAYGYEFGLFSARNVIGSSHNLLVGYNFIKINKDVPMYF